MGGRSFRSTPQPYFAQMALCDSKGRDISKMLDSSAGDFNFMGIWVTDNEYRVNDIVIDPTGNQYRCDVDIIDSTIPPSQDSEHWDLFLQGSSVLHVEILPETAEVGVFTKEQYDVLRSSILNYISRKGEIYRLADISDMEYLTYTHVSIDTSQATKPGVLKVIRVNTTTYAWELLQYT